MAHTYMPFLFPLDTKPFRHRVWIESMPLFALLNKYTLSAPFFFLITEFLIKIIGLAVKLEINLVSEFESP